nr:amidohydrolase family protein [Treponemataceae bacterium]
LADSKDNELRHSIVIDSSLADVDFSMCRKFKIGLILESDFSKDLFFPLGNCVRNNVSVSLALKNRPFEFLLNSILSDDERVKTSVYEVLRCLTYNGAKSCHSEKNVGSLEKGKCADFLILNQSPYACDKEKLSDTKIEKLFINGNEVTVQNQSAISALISGVFKKK